MITLLSNPPQFTETNPIKIEQHDVTLRIRPNLNIQLSSGTLWVSEGFLAFYSNESARGFSVDYPSVALHALARDPESQKPMLYCQLSELFPIEEVNGVDQDDDGYDVFTELNFVFPTLDNADEIYLAISQCQELYPDEEQDEEIEEYEGEEGVYSDADEVPEHILAALERGLNEQENNEESEKAEENHNQVNGKSN